ncbi:MAG: hydroxyacid dehydrogenase [Cryomorphaceae bacterium]|nr:MAG: hydroxyacid dehydrogenase [Cryomorphaceae bacterium]
MPQILLTNAYSPEVLKVVEALVPGGFTFTALPEATPQALMHAAPQADYFLASGRLRITADVIAAAPLLRMVQRTGVGTDGLDADALRNRQIPVYVNRGINARSVAEHTVLLVLSLLRQLIPVHTQTQNATWLKNETGLRCHSLQGKQIGLVGLGNIGTHVARMLAPFDVQRVYYKPQPLPAGAETELGVRYADWETLLATSDVICLLCPLNESTRALINRDTLARMKRGVFLVNTARGPLVNEAHLAEALHSGQVAGAALDVFEKEPLSPDADILKAPNTVLTPHVGGLTIETFTHMMSSALNNIRLFHHGQTQAIEANRWM